MFTCVEEDRVRQMTRDSHAGDFLLREDAQRDSSHNLGHQARNFVSPGTCGNCHQPSRLTCPELVRHGFTSESLVVLVGDLRFKSVNRVEFLHLCSSETCQCAKHCANDFGDFGVLHGVHQCVLDASRVALQLGRCVLLTEGCDQRGILQHLLRTLLTGGDLVDCCAAGWLQGRGPELLLRYHVRVARVLVLYWARILHPRLNWARVCCGCQPGPTRVALHPGRVVKEPERQPYVRWTTCYDFEEMRNIELCSYIFSFFLHCCFRCRNFHSLRHRNELVKKTVVTQRISSFLQ